MALQTIADFQAEVKKCMSALTPFALGMMNDEDGTCVGGIKQRIENYAKRADLSPELVDYIIYKTSSSDLDGYAKNGLTENIYLSAEKLDELFVNMEEGNWDSRVNILSNPNVDSATVQKGLRSNSPAVALAALRVTENNPELAADRPFAITTVMKNGTNEQKDEAGEMFARIIAGITEATQSPGNPLADIRQRNATTSPFSTPSAGGQPGR